MGDPPLLDGEPPDGPEPGTRALTLQTPLANGPFAWPPTLPYRTPRFSRRRYWELAKHKAEHSPAMTGSSEPQTSAQALLAMRRSGQLAHLDHRLAGRFRGALRIARRCIRVLARDFLASRPGSDIDALREFCSPRT